MDRSFRSTNGFIGTLPYRDGEKGGGGEEGEEGRGNESWRKEMVRWGGGGGEYSHARKSFDNSAISFPGSFTFFPHLSTPS